MNIDILMSFCIILKYKGLRISGYKLFHIKTNKQTKQEQKARKIINSQTHKP